jgi:hypothetical protein
MKTYKRGLVILIVFCFVAISIIYILKPWEPTPAEILQAEQEIYSAVLFKEKFYKNVPLVEFTCSSEVGRTYKRNDPEKIQAFGEFISGDFPEIEKSVWFDYIEKNQQTYQIENYLSPNSDVYYVNPVNDNTIDKYVTLSRVGFNKNLTQALVLLGTCSGDRCSDSNSEFMLSLGYYYFLEKKDDSWKVIDTSLGWIGEAPSP